MHHFDRHHVYGNALLQQLCVADFLTRCLSSVFFLIWVIATFNNSASAFVNVFPQVRSSTFAIWPAPRRLSLRETHRQSENAPNSPSLSSHFDHPNVGVLYHPNGRSVQFGPVQLQSQLLIPSSPANAFGLRQQKPVTGIVAPAAAIAVDEPNSDDKWLISSALRGSAFTGSSGNARYAAFSVSNPYQPTGTLNLLVPKNFVRTKKKDAYTVVYPVTSTTLPSEVEPITVATADVRNFLSVTVSDVLTGATPVPSQEDLQTLLQTLFGW